MSPLTPIYSAETECQDCYKCIRECPVKAIKVEQGHAAIMPELCVVCGHCVDICPSGAKRVRDDLHAAQTLLQQKTQVFLSLAPSFVSEFSDISPAQLIHAIKQLGFTGISETALGAQQVSAHLARTLDDASQQLLLSSACPVAVELVMKYLPSHAARVTRMYSPLLAHCRLLREEYGSDIGIVFVGPCIAKKLEAHTHPELLDVAITFDDLRRWFAAEGIVPEDLSPTPEDIVVPEAAAEGALYPVEGGMIEATRVHCRERSTRFISISGVENIMHALRTLDADSLHGNLFLELLACHGGCVNGPKARKQSPVASHLQVMNYAKLDAVYCPRTPSIQVADIIDTQEVAEVTYTEEQITSVLQRVGKRTAKDELNCGGCGYDSCREFATAILAGKAETSMCVSYMRTLAQKKANAMLRTMPYGVVIVGEDLRVIECNEQFARMCGEETMLAFDVQPGLANATLPKLVPFADLFAQVLHSGEEIIRQNLRLRDKLVSASIFTIEEQRVVGAILLDVTNTEAHRMQIIEKAQQVISNTLSTAQEIAFLMGKNAAESECILNSIIEGFAAPAPDEEGETRDG